MKTGADWKDRLKALLEAQDYDGALEVLAELESRQSLTAAELVLKGRCIQLGSEQAPALIEAEKAFAEALMLDEMYLPALLELAWFYYAVEDDSARALPFFEKAIALSQAQLTACDGQLRLCQRLVHLRHRLCQQLSTHEIAMPNELSVSLVVDGPGCDPNEITATAGLQPEEVRQSARLAPAPRGTCAEPSTQSIYAEAAA